MFYRLRNQIQEIPDEILLNLQPQSIYVQPEEEKMKIGESCSPKPLTALWTLDHQQSENEKEEEKEDDSNPSVEWSSLFMNRPLVIEEREWSNSTIETLFGIKDLKNEMDEHESTNALIMEDDNPLRYKTFWDISEANNERNERLKIGFRQRLERKVRNGRPNALIAK